MIHTARFSAFGLLSVSLVCGLCSVAVAQEKKSLAIEDYALWRSIGSTSISEKGDWISYAYRQPKKDSELHLVQLDSDKKHEIERGSNPTFSDDSRFAVYTLNPPVKDKSSGKGKPESGDAPDSDESSAKAELLDLDKGTKRSWSNVASRRFSKGARLLAIHKKRADRKAKHQGADLILHHLDKGHDELIGSVESFSFNKPGTLLAYTVSAADQNGNGLYLLNLETGARRVLDNDQADYARLTWSEKGTALAALKGTEKKGYTHKTNKLLGFVGLDTEESQRHEFQAADAFGFPKDMVISELAGITWSEDLTKLFFGLKKQAKKQEKEKNADPIADVDIWHWDDERIQSVQMVAANRDRNRTDRAVFHLTEKKFVRLSDKTMRSITITRDGKWGIGQDNRAYLSDWEETRADYYLVDTKSGERTVILKEHRRALGLSPASDYYLLWKEGHVWAYHLATQAMTNLTKDAPVSFVNEEADHPGEAPSYGVTGWTKDGKSVILTHRYDLWIQPLDGSKATCLTQGKGAEKEIRFRYVRTDPEERFIDHTQPMLLSAYGQWTKKSGFYRLEKELTELIYDDKSFGRVSKAKSADKFLFTAQTFSEYPDYYISDGTFSSPKRMTEANPQQVEYLWGHRLLFDYTNSKGVRLQGTLAVPDDYREGEKLPMLVNYYEKNSQNMHRYPSPRYASAPQFSGFVSNRYLVMQPDIHFNTRTSHADMLECIEAAIAKVVEMGYVDAERIGLHGHSYSGQGSAYISTRSETFAAIVAGAAATNLVSDFNQLWKSAGTNQHRYDIYGQGRFGTNPFDDPELYRDQSAVHHARTMNTPLLLLHGTSDGSVEWLQAVEFYNALRFNGKNVILLSYPGEGHGLRKRENQIDFQVRMREFFDHHLKGAAPPVWMSRGIPFLEKKKKK